MLIDYHMHLEEDGYPRRCRFNVERVRTYVEAAQARGIDEIGITEHAHRFRQFGPVMRPMLRTPGTHPTFAAWADLSFDHDLNEYVEAVLAAKAEGLPVKLGLEVDWIPGQAEAIAEMLAPYPWDFVLGSVHFLGNWPVDYSADVGWPDRDVDAVYEEYCRTLAEMARTGLFHVLAHLDLVKKFGHRPRKSMKDAWQAVVEAAVEAGCCIEISTAGLRKPVGEIYPGEDLLRMCREAGLPITLASDAHRPEDVGYAAAEAVAWARRCGYDRIAVFSRGEYRLEPLGTGE